MKTGILLAALCAAATTVCAQNASLKNAEPVLLPDTPVIAEPTEPAPGAAWSLDDCIGYALHNNINVQQRALQIERNSIDLSTSRFSRLPSLNASAGATPRSAACFSSDKHL